jgi:hypothetical protein
VRFYFSLVAGCVRIESVKTLNDIPDYLHEDRIDDWTPERGFVTGVLSTLLAGVVIAFAVSTLTYYVPTLTTQWLLNLVWGLLVAWVLFTVMHKASRLVSVWWSTSHPYQYGHCSACRRC